jgi:hypothetical protein
MLVMTGRVTMLGISRWAGKGGSYRTIQRFFATVIPWTMLFWVFFRQHVYGPGEVYLLVGDEGVVTKAGKITYGLDRCFGCIKVLLRLLYAEAQKWLRLCPIPPASVDPPYGKIGHS